MTVDKMMVVSDIPAVAKSKGWHFDETNEVFIREGSVVTNTVLIALFEKKGAAAVIEALDTGEFVKKAVVPPVKD